MDAEIVREYVSDVSAQLEALRLLLLATTVGKPPTSPMGTPTKRDIGDEKSSDLLSTEKEKEKC